LLATSEEYPMSYPVSVTFDGVDASEALTAKVVERAARLERFATDIVSCRVAIAAASHRHRHGDLFNVHVTLALRDGQLDAQARHQDAYVAVAESFDALRRRTEDHARRRRDAATAPAAS
jgi:ribosomal subunit interface protein